MSSPSDLVVVSSLDGLAPQFRAAVLVALSSLTVDAYVYESLRSQALQTLYFERGASKAASVLSSWHGYGLAVDVISRARGWAVWPTRQSDGSLTGGDPSWYTPVAAAFVSAGCSWGGDWTTFPDMPHFQWGKCRASPSDEARTLYASGGLPAVWAAVGAA